MERKEYREWLIYDKQKDNFYNLDACSSMDEQYVKDLPYKGFTFEECKAFLVHVDNKEFCEIINIQKPKFLLNFELEAYRKQQIQLKAKENQEFNINLNQMQIDIAKRNAGKNDFDQAFNKWVQSKSIFATEKELQNAQPKIENYGLAPSNFDERERKHLKLYGYKADWLN